MLFFLPISESNNPNLTLLFAISEASSFSSFDIPLSGDEFISSMLFVSDFGVEFIALHILLYSSFSKVSGKSKETETANVSKICLFALSRLCC